MVTPESQRLRDGIRAGRTLCPSHRFCNPFIGAHMADCPWTKAVDRIYEIEREEEGDEGINDSNTTVRARVHFVGDYDAG